MRPARPLDLPMLLMHLLESRCTTIFSRVSLSQRVLRKDFAFLYAGTLEVFPN